MNVGYSQRRWLLSYIDRVLTILGEWSTLSFSSTDGCPTSKFAANPLYVIDIPDASGNKIPSFRCGVATRLMPRDG